MRFFLIFFCLLCVSLASCVGTATKQTTKLVARPQPTPMIYDKWRTQSFTNILLSIDLPARVKAEEVFDGKSWILSMGFHYLSPPPWILDDATVFVHVYVSRISLDQFAEQKACYLSSGLYKRGGEEDHKFWYWYFEQHPETVCWDGKGRYSSYRRDVTVNEKEILHIDAEVLNAGPQDSQDADHAAVKRIMDSIVPLATLR